MPDQRIKRLSKVMKTSNVAKRVGNSCIYSTLLHIKDLAESIGIPTLSITFNDPHWFKAVEIFFSKN